MTEMTTIQLLRAAWPLHKNEAKVAFDMFDAWCAPAMPRRIPGMGTQERLAIRLHLGKSVEQAASSEYLYRWHELECGDSNDHGSWCITRGSKKITRGSKKITRGFGKTHSAFEHDDDGKPFLEHHHYAHGQGKDSVSYSAMADRERGALKRLAAIMARYPGFVSYVQGDPRGCALYILAPDTLQRYQGQPVDTIYNNGIAVYK